MTATSQTHWRKVHRRLNDSLLFAEDLGGKTRVDVEIVDSGVTKVSDGDSSKDMPWIAFKGAKKRLACNATNCKTMQTLSGTGVIEEWRGPITLVVVKTRFKDRKTKETIETDTIRIAPKRPRPFEPDATRLAARSKTTIDAPIADDDELNEFQQTLKAAIDAEADREPHLEAEAQPPRPGDGYTFDPEAAKED